MATGGSSSAFFFPVICVRKRQIIHARSSGAVPTLVAPTSSISGEATASASAKASSTSEPMSVSMSTGILSAASEGEAKRVSAKSATARREGEGMVGTQGRGGRHHSCMREHRERRGVSPPVFRFTNTGGLTPRRSPETSIFLLALVLVEEVENLRHVLPDDAPVVAV